MGRRKGPTAKRSLIRGASATRSARAFLWTAGGWFDYLNLRTHGYDFHMALTAGEVEWTDDRVRETFANWRELLDMGAFIDDHTAYSWQEAQALHGQWARAVAYLMGNFVGRPDARSRADRMTSLGSTSSPRITPPRIPKKPKTRRQIS